MGMVLSRFCGWWRDSVREEVYPETSSSSSSFLSCHELGEINSEVSETNESSSSSSSYAPTNYDVFLSFSGKDTRLKFTSHLFRELDLAGIRTFMDEAELRKGKVISDSLFKAIAESRISIPIFSPNYASSKWCLNELVDIMKSKETMRQTVFPIFYHVTRQDVQEQTECFGQQFEQLAKNFDSKQVESWKKALKQAGKLKEGWDIRNIANGNESLLIQIVVKTVWRKLREASFDVPKNLVGIGSSMIGLLNLLDLGSKDVKIVGICGMRGIGKTTLAEVIFNQIRQNFEGSLFLEDIREVSKTPKGIVCLQKLLLSAILKQKFQLISNVNEGKSFIKRCLHAKEVLIVLDDVDNIEQLEALAGQPNWFGRGSRIIITTRDEHLLNVHKVRIYNPKELDFDHSLKLFSKHAFGKDYPPQDFFQLAVDVVHTTGGFPLSLKSLGSFLSDKRCPTLWRSALDRLKNNPHKNV